MSEGKKSLLTTSNGITTGGIGALLTTLVPVIIPDAENKWRPALYAMAPIVSSIITYLMSWVVSRFGFESPAEAALRTRFERDIKSIEKQLGSKHLTPEFRCELMQDREKTVRQLVNIGKKVRVSSTLTTDENQ